MRCSTAAIHASLSPSGPGIASRRASQNAERRRRAEGERETLGAIWNATRIGLRLAGEQRHLSMSAAYSAAMNRAGASTAGDAPSIAASTSAGSARSSCDP